MSAPKTTGPQPDGPGLQPPDFGRPSPALLERADRGYARFLAHTSQPAQDDHTVDHAPDGAARTR
ncbi:hypothetical protein ACPCUV_37200 [Streptomyces platensis]|uniref:hypothetical protein n=1 Tax=Streptomyces platensis TaxID=58346 RepID=UPI003C2F76F0